MIGAEESLGTLGAGNGFDRSEASSEDRRYTPVRYKRDFVGLKG